MKLEIALHPKQGEALKALASPDTEILGYGGAKGGGKSHLGRTWQILRRITYPGSKGLTIRKTFPDLERTHIERIKKDFKGVYADYSERKHTFEFSNGSVQEMAYLDHESDVDRYWGAEYDDIFIDEGQQHALKVFQTLRTCLRTTKPDLRVKMLVGFNWGGIGHGWLKQKFWNKVYDEKENPNNFSFLHAKVKDNPSLIDNDPGYIARLEALPEQLRKAYLEGDPNALEGQFFTEFTTALREQPFRIERSAIEGRLYGSLDSGTTHNTSFGLWYLDDNLKMHRLLTYCNNGATIREHAQEIFNRLEAFSWTDGYFPEIVWADPSMWTKVRLNEYSVRSPIDEYIELFRDRGRKTQFQKANNEKVNGCQVMRTLFKVTDNNPQFSYFTGYNASFEEGITAGITDENNAEVYQKMDGDDVIDEARYGMVGCFSVRATLNQRKKNVVEPTHLELLLKNRLPHQRGQKSDWYNGELKVV